MSEELVSLFTGAGLSEQKAKETIKNEAVTISFKQAIDQVNIIMTDRRFCSEYVHDAMSGHPNAFSDSA